MVMRFTGSLFSNVIEWILIINKQSVQNFQTTLYQPLHIKNESCATSHHRVTKCLVVSTLLLFRDTQRWNLCWIPAVTSWKLQSIISKSLGTCSHTRGVSFPRIWWYRIMWFIVCVFIYSYYCITTCRDNRGDWNSWGC